MKIKIKKRDKNSHKGENGEALIIGGSEDYAGCLALAGLAALRTGIDWITIAAPEKVGWAVQSLTPDLVVKKFKGKHFTKKHLPKILKLAENFDAVLIGNGIGRKSDAFVKEFIKKVEKPLVIDADGIKAIELKDAKNAILTPHRKELELLLHKSKITDKELQNHINDNVVVIKGAVDHIVSKEKIMLNRTGNAGMTVGGTGDVLAGIALGFLAQGYSKFDSAVYAAKINGNLGDQLKKKKGYSFIASDLVEDMKKLKGKKRF